MTHRLSLLLCLCAGSVAGMADTTGCSSNSGGGFGGSSGVNGFGGGEDGGAATSSGGLDATSPSNAGSSGTVGLASSGSSGGGNGSGAVSSNGGPPSSSSGGSNASSSGGASNSSGSSGAAGSSGSSSSSGAAPLPADSGLVGDPNGGSCTTPSGITSQQTTALMIVNQTRASMGAPCDTMVAALNTSATKHCQYYAANVSNQMCIADPHVEVSGCTDYVSANFNDRETAAGYSGSASAEIMAFDDNPTAALGQWLGSIYHRQPLLDPWQRDFGYGGATMCDTIDFGLGAGASTPTDVVLAYPYNGQTGVPHSFLGSEEEPTPPAPPSGWPSGYPITIFIQSSSITLTTDDLHVMGGAAVAHQDLLPQNAMGYLQDGFVLYGNVPYSSQTTYVVHVAGTASNTSWNGQTSSAPFNVSFSFTTM